MTVDLLADVAGPCDADLAAIEAEWPLIDAEMALVEAEIRVLTADRLTCLDWRRLRRAEVRVCREIAAFLSESSSRPVSGWAA